MPIFGDFTSIPMPDLMSLIGQSTGSLMITRYDQQHIYVLSINNRKITRLLFNEQDVIYPDQAVSFITELIQCSIGDFEFERREVSPGSLLIPINELLVTSLSMIDEMIMLRPHFPEADTLFICDNTSIKWINEDMNMFWDVASPLLAEGISATQLQNQLGIFLDQVLLKLYKLRSMNLIRPKRIFNIEMFKEKEPSTPSPALTVNQSPAPKTNSTPVEEVKPPVKKIVMSSQKKLVAGNVMKSIGAKLTSK